MRLGGLKDCTLPKVAHSGPKKIFAFIFQLSGGALMASSCFALQFPDVQGYIDAAERHVIQY